PAIIRNGSEVKIDYNYCKGCGICAEECPRKAITMVPEEI
ncbi:MAG: 4Fe-4S binding protein, partial [Thermoproteota archaeon]